MNKSTLDKANRLVKTIDTLNVLYLIVHSQYLQFSCHDKKVDSTSLDEETLSELKETIKNFIDEKERKLLEEFNAL